MGVSNKIISILNFTAILCSILIIGSGLWLANKPDSHCIRAFRWPLLILGLLILLVALAGFIGAYWNKAALLAFHLFFMSLLILLLLILLVFAFVVTRPTGAYQVAGRGYEEYRLDGFSSWLRDRVADSANWNKISLCLSHSTLCSRLTQDYFAPQDFFAAHISPLQSGCCKPPTICGYSYVSPTVWINPTNPIADPDCLAWSNDQSQLCYNCNACKAGLLGNLRKEWRRVNVFLIIAVVVLIFIYVIGCSAFKNAQTEDLFRRYKRGWV
uniref:Tetraspanin-2 n=1 Tax=Kalanchoe fedtschenkoi TaxID=63787 RepID=A0A7N1A7W6_KALFE